MPELQFSVDSHPLGENIYLNNMQSSTSKEMRDQLSFIVPNHIDRSGRNLKRFTESSTHSKPIISADISNVEKSQTNTLSLERIIGPSFTNDIITKKAQDKPNSIANDERAATGSFKLDRDNLTVRMLETN